MWLDPGRFTVTDKETFKTPTLREIAQMGSYYVDGSLERSEEMIKFYNQGSNPNPYLDAELWPLNR